MASRALGELVQQLRRRNLERVLLWGSTPELSALAHEDWAGFEYRACYGIRDETSGFWHPSPAPEVAEWDCGLVVVIGSGKENLIADLAHCIERARYGAVLVVELDTNSLQTSSGRSALDLLSKHPLRLYSGTLTETILGEERVVVVCRKLSLEEQSAPITNVLASEGDQTALSRIATAAAIGSDLSANGLTRGCIVPWLALFMPVVTREWIDMSVFGARSNAEVVALGAHCILRALKNSDEVVECRESQALIIHAARGVVRIAGTIGADETFDGGWHAIELESSSFTLRFLERALLSPPAGLGFHAATRNASRLVDALRLWPLALISEARQSYVVDGYATAEAIKNSLDALHDRLPDQTKSLWGTEGQSRPALAELKDVDRILASKAADSIESSISERIESLPAPLAAILCAWQVSLDTKERMELLLHFFEAALILHATWLLSGFYSESLSSRVNHLATDESGKNPLIARASIGTWRYIIDKYASEVRDACARESKGDVNKADAIRSGFADRSLLIPQTLSNQELAIVFARANELRNEKTGHGGHLTNADIEGANRQLDNILCEYLQLTRAMWSVTRLVSVGAMSLTRGKYALSCNVLRGSKLSEPLVLSLEKPVESNSLALYADDEATCLSLLPLLRIVPRAGSTVGDCSFYARTERDGVARYVFYHPTEQSLAPLDVVDSWGPQSPLQRLAFGPI